MQTVRVLLIEDDEDDFVLVRDLLAEAQRWAFELEWASSAEAGGAAMARGGHDVCLLDYRLGPESGLDLLRAARATGYSAPVILLTGQDALEVDLEAMHAGAADYLVKAHLDATTLERGIRYALEEARRLQERVQLVNARQAQAIAEAANQAKDEFLAVISHELRNPLNAILGWTQVLRGVPNDPAILERAMAAIERSAHAQKQLIDDLLDLSRVTAGKLRLDPAPVNLAEVLEAALEVVRPAAAAKGIELRAEILPAPKILGDRDRLQQVFWNLLMNAVKFTPSGGYVRLSISHTEAAVSVSISDNGPGIPQAMLSRIFERFRQLDTESSTRHGGLGLGLALVRELVNAQGGKVIAQSPGADGGACFVVTLPRL